MFFDFRKLIIFLILGASLSCCTLEAQQSSASPETISLLDSFLAERPTRRNCDKTFHHGEFESEVNGFALFYLGELVGDGGRFKEFYALRSPKLSCELLVRSDRSQRPAFTKRIVVSSALTLMLSEDFRDFFEGVERHWRRICDKETGATQVQSCLASASEVISQKGIGFTVAQTDSEGFLHAYLVWDDLIYKNGILHND